ncbi:MAG: protein BatD [Candidatus Coatesbacteria bacterium]|nr:protein BatD [Candidatus Coatesbacteria bacterium]
MAAFFLVVSVLWALCGSAVAAPASIEATVSKSSIFIDDQITLTITARGIDGEPELPDMSDDFTVVSQSQSRSMTIINMQIDSSTTYQYVLQPEKAGVLQIPSIRARAGSKRVRTQPIQVQVLDRQSKPKAQEPVGPSSGRPQAGAGEPETQTEGDENIFIRAQVDKDSVFLGEQLTLTFRLFSKTDLGSADYTAPTCTNFWKEDIEGQNRYTTVVGGKRYRVEELTTALFPTKTGPQTIGPASLVCTIDTFFMPSFSFRRGGLERPRHLTTKPISVTVKPLPEGAPADFSGTVGQFSIEAATDQKSVEVGKPITLKVRIWGTGNVKTIQQIATPRIEGFDVYEPNVKESIDRKKSPISGDKSFEFVMVPRAPGAHVIPSLAFSFFDPRANEYQTVRTRPIEVSITGQASESAETPVGGLLNRTDVTPTGTDIRYIRPKMTAFEDFRQDLFRRLITPILILLPGLVAIGLCLKSVVAQRFLADTGLRGARKEAIRGLAKANARMNPDAPQEFYSEVAKSLINYVSKRFDVPAPGVSAVTVGALMADSEDGKHAASLASECLEVCDFYRFSAQRSSTEEMRNVASKVDEAISMLHRIAPKKGGSSDRE